MTFCTVLTAVQRGGIGLPTEDIMAKKTRKPPAPKDDESDPEEKAEGVLIGPIPYELIGLYEKLRAVDRPLERAAPLPP